MAGFCSELRGQNVDNAEFEANGQIVSLLTPDMKDYVRIQLENGLFVHIYPSVMQAAVAKGPEAGYYSGEYVIPDFVDYTDGDGQSVKVPIVDVMDAFTGEDNLKSLCLNKFICRFGYQAFWGCMNLKKLIIPEESIIEFGKDSLTGTSIDELVLGKKTAFDEYALAFTYKNDTLDFSRYNVVLCENCFDGCEANLAKFRSDAVMKKGCFNYLNSVKVLEFVGTTLSEENREMLFDRGDLGSFYYYLRTIRCQWPEPPVIHPYVGETVLSLSKDAIFVADLYVPKASVEKYRNDPVWGKFSNIYALEDAGAEGITSDSAQEVIKVEYFDQTGRKTSPDANASILLRRETLSDGTTRTTKHLAR